VMAGVYLLIALLGCAFLVAAVSGPTVQMRTAVQAALFLALGGGGLVMGRRTSPQRVP
jgi:hypothetical protein